MIGRVFLVWLVALVAALPQTIAAQDAAPPGVAPVAIRIPQALVDTVIEPLAIPGGVPALPTSPWTVGWYEDTAPLGVPGNIVMAGYSDWWDVGPAVLRYVGLLPPGSLIELIGADGNLYRYALEWVDSYPRDTAPIGVIFDAGLGTDEMLTIYLGADPYDPVTSEYLSILVLRARRTADAPVPAPAQAPSTLYDPAGCPVAPNTLPLPSSDQPWPYPVAPADDPAPSAYFEPLGIPQAVPAGPDIVAAIDAEIAKVTPCKVAVRSALHLPDGNVLALVGPVGAIPLAEITGTILPDTRGVTDPTLANLFAYLLYVPEDGGWKLPFSPPQP